MSLMSLREYARHRKVSLAAVQKALNSRRIILARQEQHGSKVLKFVDPVLADQMWNERTDPKQQRVATRGEMGRDEPEPIKPEYGDQQNLFPDVNANDNKNVQSKNSQGAYGDAYNKARAVTETYNAKIKELEYKEKVSVLVNKDELARDLFNISSGILENLLNIPGRIAPLIHSRCISFTSELSKNKDAKLDIKEIEDIISGEIKDVCEVIANGVKLN